MKALHKVAFRSIISRFATHSSRRRARLGSVTLFAVAWMLQGCISGPSGPASDYSGSLTADLSDAATSPRLARLQVGDSPPLAPPPTFAPPPNLPSPPEGPPVGSGAPEQFTVRVRAWVNGKPLFDDEVFQGLPRDAVMQLQSLPEPQRSQRMRELMFKQVEHVIEQELMYQDAVRKLERNNPKALDKLREMVDEQYQKRLRMIRSTGKVDERQLRDLSKILERKIAREFVAQEYMRSRVFPLLTHAVGPVEVRDYYENHRNEFKKLENVKWQDVFIAVGPKHPTIADARRFAEDLIAQCRRPEDFEKLIKYDDGDGKFRNGEGVGSRRGEIRPPAVEKYLFELREGEIGPVVEISTGVHIIRLLKYEPGGLIGFTPETQEMIRNKLRNELAEREIRRMVRELKSRAIIEIDEDIN